VKSVRGAADGLHVSFSRSPTDNQLRELIALLFRYGLDMKPLAAFKTTKNKIWFADKKTMFWHGRVFGQAKILRK
jgi:hypothetical protein